jgi:hypothetical protein
LVENPKGEVLLGRSKGKRERIKIILKKERGTEWNPLISIKFEISGGML